MDSMCRECKRLGRANYATKGKQRCIRQGFARVDNVAQLRQTSAFLEGVAA